MIHLAAAEQPEPRHPPANTSKMSSRENREARAELRPWGAWGGCRTSVFKQAAGRPAEGEDEDASGKLTRLAHLCVNIFIFTTEVDLKPLVNCRSSGIHHQRQKLKLDAIHNTNWVENICWRSPIETRPSFPSQQPLTPPLLPPTHPTPSVRNVT